MFLYNLYFYYVLVLVYVNDYKHNAMQEISNIKFHVLSVMASDEGYLFCL